MFRIALVTLLVAGFASPSHAGEKKGVKIQFRIKNVMRQVPTTFAHDPKYQVDLNKRIERSATLVQNKAHTSRTFARGFRALVNKKFYSTYARSDGFLGYVEPRKKVYEGWDRVLHVVGIHTDQPKFQPEFHATYSQKKIVRAIRVFSNGSTLEIKARRVSWTADSPNLVQGSYTIFNKFGDRIKAGRINTLLKKSPNHYASQFLRAYDDAFTANN